MGIFIPDGRLDVKSAYIYGSYIDVMWRLFFIQIWCYYTMPSNRQTMIQQQLEAALAPISIDIIDESHLHAGHGAKGGHYRLHIIADLFAGKSILQRHRLVYDALSNLMNNGIHALSIQAKSPDEGG